MQCNPRSASVHSSSLFLAVAGLVVPAMLVLGTSVSARDREVVSVFVAVVLISLYLAALAFTNITHAHLFRVPERGEAATWPTWLALAVLTASAFAVGIESDLLVGSLYTAIEALHIPTVFVGLIVIPVIGNAAEHASAIFFALKNKADVTVEIAVGSSTQVAMFVAPLLVFVSLFIGQPIDFVFAPFEIGIVALAPHVHRVIGLDVTREMLDQARRIASERGIANADWVIGDALPCLSRTRRSTCTPSAPRRTISPTSTRSRPRRSASSSTTTTPRSSTAPHHCPPATSCTRSRCVATRRTCSR